MVIVWLVVAAVGIAVNAEPRGRQGRAAGDVAAVAEGSSSECVNLLQVRAEAISPTLPQAAEPPQDPAGAGTAKLSRRRGPHRNITSNRLLDRLLRLHTSCEHNFVRCWDARPGTWRLDRDCSVTEGKTKFLANHVRPLLQQFSSLHPGQVLGRVMPMIREDLGREWEGVGGLGGGGQAVAGAGDMSEHSCVEVLCTSWMEERCMRGGGMCNEVNRMCELTDYSTRSSNGVFTRVSNLQRWPLSAIPAFRGIQSSLIFLHIPKNAGTAIEEAGLAQGVRWGRHWTWGTVEMPDGYWCNKYHVPPAFLPDSEKYDAGEVFCVTRHPYDRAVSEYKYLLSVPWGHEYLGDSGSARECSAHRMNSFIARSLTFYLQGHRFSKDCHMIPQSEFVWSGDRQWCKDILRVEDFPHSFDNLMRSRGMNVQLREENAAQTCPELTVKSLNRQALRLLDHVYRNDFRLLNYDTASHL